MVANERRRWRTWARYEPETESSDPAIYSELLHTVYSRFPALRRIFPCYPTMAEIKRSVKNPILFECAWEVANKVGGIYTVIKTKVPVTVSEYGDRYTLIGPLSYKTAPMEVEQVEPKDPHLAATLDSMRTAGVKILYGKWLIEGAPNVLLFDTGSQYSRLDEWKGDLWNLAGIPTPPNDHETNETIVFGYLVAWFVGDVSTLFLSRYFLSLRTWSRLSAYTSAFHIGTYTHRI